MFTQKELIFLYAETSAHIGGGESTGVIDKAIQRERYTGFPVGPASGIKGAIRDWFEHLPHGSNGEFFSTEEEREDKVRLTFGPDDANGADHAGAAAFTDARILLFPVRSLSGVFAWITCPTVLHRLNRDLKMTGKDNKVLKLQSLDAVDPGIACGLPGHACSIEGKVVLEEYAFTFKHGLTGLAKIVEQIGQFFPDTNEYSYWKERVGTHLLVLSDNDFRDFVKHSTEVRARVKLGEGKSSDTSKGGNLFYEEYLPCDSLMYALVFSQEAFGEKIKNGEKDAEWGSDEDVMGLLKKMDKHRIQFGADESIGRGIMYLNFLNVNSKNGKSNE